MQAGVPGLLLIDLPAGCCFMYSNRLSVLCLIAALSFCSTASGQSTGLELARAKHCLSCHQVDAKRVGPAFTLIAQRFQGQESAVNYLADTIRSGGRGRWGPVPMPAQPQVSPADAERIAAWILSLAPVESSKTE